MLVLVAALATQWVLVARRERASRGRAEHLAEVAEAERARAEAADREKGRFLGMLSHELLTPLQSIWSTIDVIESRGRVDATDAAFRRLKEATRSLRGRISDLLDFAKMSSGRLETRIRGFQLDKLIDTALRDVEEALAERNLDVHWEAGPELAQRIYSDPARLRQVLDNLLTNAIKYTERGGISIAAELLPQQGVMRIEISDTGVGIDGAAMARLYEPFYRSPLTAAMAEGSGLGLAVVRSLVDLMGGTIRFDSQLGQGTVVTVEVPITEGTDGLVVDAPVRVDVRRPVLVVDDSRDARRAIAEVLRSLGVEVVEAADGLSGLAAAAAGDFQAIFLDLQMPDLTGLQVAQRLRQTGDRHQKTFLALVSAYNDLDDATLDAVFDARIDKPATRKDLMAALSLAAQARASP
jgi:CheY-like chemotaxis protein